MHCVLPYILYNIIAAVNFYSSRIEPQVMKKLIQMISKLVNHQYQDFNISSKYNLRIYSNFLHILNFLIHNKNVPAKTN